MSNKFWQLYLCCLALLGLVACAPARPNVSPLLSPVLPETTSPSSTGTVPFATVKQAQPLGTEPGAPYYAAVAQPGEWNQLRSHLPAAAIEAGQHAAQTAPALYLVAAAGRKGSSGYRITIESITQEGKLLNVMVTQTAPQPEAIVEPAATLPYHLVVVDPQQLPAAASYDIVFRTEQGDELQRQTITLQP
jgi:hypothetical protein